MGLHPTSKLSASPTLRPRFAFGFMLEELVMTQSAVVANEAYLLRSATIRAWILVTVDFEFFMRYLRSLLSHHWSFYPNYLALSGQHATKVT